MYGAPMKGPYPVREHPLYRRWCFMKQVCYNPKHADYKSYGAKGVKVSEDFMEFWDFVDIVERKLGLPPYGKVSKLARIDQDGDYTIRNLKWDVAKNVGRRHKSSHKLKYRTKTQTVRDWSEQTGINFHTLLGRMERGWTAAQCLGYKPGPRAIYIEEKKKRNDRITKQRAG